MRIIDGETHPLLPKGVAAAYREEEDSPAERKLSDEVAERSLAAGEFDVIADDLLAQMDADGISVSVIMRGYMPARNDDLVRLVREHPDRFAALGSWDLEQPEGRPPRESAKALQALDRGLAMEEIRGVGEISLERRYYPHLPPEEACRAYVPTVELCRTHKKPIFFHTSTGGAPGAAAYRDPARLEPLVSSFPDVIFLVGHMGGGDPTLFEHALALAKAHRNVYLATQASTPAHLERALKELGPERLVFGSDWAPRMAMRCARQGTTPQRVALQVVRQAVVDEGVRARILGENLAELLRIGG